MKKFKYDIEVSAESENEADTKMKALTALAGKLNAKDLAALANSNLQAVVILVSGLKINELEKLAYILKNDPIKTAMAKQALGV